MASPAEPTGRLVRFGVFELDVYTRELRKAGVRVNVQDQPLQLLRLLLERPGELVTREELRQQLWPSDTFVGFEQGLNAAVRRLRETLGDSADAPRFIETLPRRGYRFIGTVAGDGAPAPAAGKARGGLPVGVSAEPSPGERSTRHRRSQRSLVRWTLINLATVPLLCWGAFSLGKRAGEQPQPTFHQLTFRRGSPVSARFAPDGRTVVYGAAWDGEPFRTFFTRIESPESSPLPLPDADLAAISSSAELFIILNRPNGYGPTPGTLARVPLAGGAPRRIADTVSAADWAHDHQHFAVSRNVGERWRVEYPLGTVVHESEQAWGVRISPDGNRVAFLTLTPKGLALAVADRAGRTTVLSDGWKWAGRYVAWSRGGDEVWFTPTKGGWSTTLRAVSLSGRERTVLTLPGWIVVQDISAEGRVLLTFAKGGRTSIVCHSPDRAGERDLSWFESSGVRGLSADGKLLLFAEVGDATPVASAFVRRIDGSPPTRLGEGLPFSLSPDGKWALVNDEARRQLVLLPTGPGEPKRLTRQDVDWSVQPSWLSDSKHLLVAAGKPGHLRTHAFDFESGDLRPLTPEGLLCLTTSPDGLQALCEPDAQQQRRIYSFDQGQASAVHNLGARDDVLSWSADGHSLLIRPHDEFPMRVYRLDPVEGTRDLLREIVVADRAGLFHDGVRLYITPDGETYCYSAQRALGDLFVVDGLR
jgi:DNA-binding winged helix-turn-helix (wHTH) protein/Tol biopolymer transport system component